MGDPDWTDNQDRMEEAENEGVRRQFERDLAKTLEIARLTKRVEQLKRKVKALKDRIAANSKTAR